MGRSPSFEKGLKKGPWTSEEDQKLVAYIEEHGHGSWRALPLKAGLQRCGKSCRLRWTNYLRPDIKRGKFSLQEERTIIQLHALLGNRWSAIATHLPKRTDNEIKNYWNTHLKRRLTKMGIDPMTHKSRTATNTNLSHMTQWENARLEAEARLVRGSRLVNKSLMSSLSLPQPLSIDVLKPWQGITLSKLSNLNRIELPKNQNMSIINLVENVEPTSVLKDMIVEDRLNTLEFPKVEEGSHQNILEVSNMMYQDNYLMETFTNHLVSDANNQNCLDAFEEDNNYWSNILDKLGNNTSFSSIF